jgi:hypothetical protein
MFEKLIVAREVTAHPCRFAVAILVVGQHITAESHEMLSRFLIAARMLAKAMDDHDLSSRLRQSPVTQPQTHVIAGDDLAQFGLVHTTSLADRSPKRKGPPSGGPFRVTW